MTSASHDPKAWATACAAAAMQGDASHRTDPADGPVRVFAVGSTSRAYLLLYDAEMLSLLTKPVGGSHQAHDRGMQ